MSCRFCHHPVLSPFIDLGSAPPSNAYLSPAQMNAAEKWYPLRVGVCPQCWLAQTEDYADREELFSSDYAYFSSFSQSWLAHAEHFVATACARFALDARSMVIEVAANDGYLLRYVQAQGIPCLGVEPTSSTAAAARSLGLDIREAFFGRDLARQLVTEGYSADLTVANNVLAHVPDINDFVAGFAILLKPDGVASFEFPHLLCLMEEAQFDTLYHEHYSYLSLTAVRTVFAANGLQVFGVETLRTHGGSLRVYAQRKDCGVRPVAAEVAELVAREDAAGVRTAGYYLGLQAQAERIKFDLLAFLIDARRAGKRVAAYGAAAKGNTLLNFTGVRSDLVSFVVDRNPAKQGQYMPGSRIPIVAEERLHDERPDYILLLPWNLRSELAGQLRYTRDWGAKLVTAVPCLQVHE